MGIPVLDMFDKIDDIVYEPVSAISDWIKQPLKSFEHKREMKSKEQDARIQKEMMDKQAEIETKAREQAAKLSEQEQRLQMEKAEHDQRLNLDRNREVAEIDAQVRRWNAEIDQMINENEDARRDKLVESIKNYQITLSKAVVEISNEIGNMSLELRERAQDFVKTKTQEYIAMQDDIKKKCKEEMIEMKEMFFEDDPETYRMMVGNIIEERKSSIDLANRFIAELSDDIKRLNANIDVITRESINNTNEYLKPMTAALNIENATFDSAAYIESKNRALLEGE